MKLDQLLHDMITNIKNTSNIIQQPDQEKQQLKRENLIKYHNPFLINAILGRKSLIRLTQVSCEETHGKCTNTSMPFYFYDIYFFQPSHNILPINSIILLIMLLNMIDSMYLLTKLCGIFIVINI